MRIAIVGTGALGGFYGAMLARGGYDVHFLARRDYEKIRDNGLVVRSVQGDFHLEQVNCYRRPDEIGPVDLAFIAFKATDNQVYESLLSPLMGPRSLALTAQNGLGNEEQLAEIFGAERVAGGLAFLCANRHEDGTIEHLDYGHMHIGNYQRPPDVKLLEFGKMLESSGVRCEVVENLALSRWKKLIWNVPFNGLSTLTDQTVDKIVSDPTLRSRALALMKELQIIASVYGLNIDDAFLNLMMEYTDKMKPYYTSMHLDARAGKELEIEAIFGEPLCYAQKKNIPVPQLESLYTGLKIKYSENL